jgi:uncharacterized protein YdaU (DUF1376 family)
MPLFIGDYLADTMHLSTEEHGAYLLLLFHLWRRALLPDNDIVLAKITKLAPQAWSTSRAALAEFFEIENGQWRHSRVERERTRITAKNKSLSSQAKQAAAKRWKKPAADAPGIAAALPEDADSESESESELVTLLLQEKRRADARHTPFRGILAEYWRAKNHASPEMPWQGRDAKALSDFLAATPNLCEAQFRNMVGNRARSAVAHGDRVYLWIGNLTRYQEEITVYNKPASAGGSNASRAEINRNSVVDAVDRALSMARNDADRAGQAGPEQTAFHHAGMPAADGAGSERCARALPASRDYRMAERNTADG